MGQGEMKNTCGECRYRLDGGCHRFPPSAQALPVTVTDLQGTHQALQTVTIWPPVTESDRCGEWAPIFNFDAEMITRIQSGLAPVVTEPAKAPE